MGRARRFLRRLANVIQPDREDAGLEREIASHLTLLEDDYQRRGLSAEEARRSARLALGGVEQTKERHRDARALRWLDDARRDAVYAVRILRRGPVAAATAVLSLAIGIGLNAAVFSSSIGCCYAPCRTRPLTNWPASSLPARHPSPGRVP